MEPKRASRSSVALASAGLVLAIALGLLLLTKTETSFGPSGLTAQLLGSFLTLLGLGAGALLARHLAPALAGVAARLRERSARMPPPFRGRMLIGAALLTSVWLLAVWFRDIAYSHDHAEHCFKAYHFWKEMLGSWRICLSSPYFSRTVL